MTFISISFPIPLGQLLKKKKNRSEDDIIAIFNGEQGRAQGPQGLL